MGVGVPVKRTNTLSSKRRLRTSKNVTDHSRILGRRPTVNGSVPVKELFDSTKRSIETIKESEYSPDGGGEKQD